MTADKDKKILERIAILEKEEGELSLLLRFYRDLLRVQAAGKRESAGGNSLPDEAVRKRIQDGVPLVDPADLDFKVAPVQDLFVKVAGVCARYPELFGEVPEKLSRPAAGRLLTKKAVSSWAKGEALPPALAEGVRENVLRAIIQFALWPLLTSLRATLLPSVDVERWRRAYCPVCGGLADMAFLDRERGARWLLCSRCDAEWLFPRLECPYCGNQDQSAMAYFTDDSGRYRLQVCDKCRCYLKTIDQRTSEGEVLMPLERVLTVGMDRQAREKGYHLPS
ncbi:MAG: formate dehydrogenase accessory protein FdhE [Chloroflexota bacterium]